MPITNLHSEAILKELLVGSGIPALVRLATKSGQVPPTIPSIGPSADEVARMSLDDFAKAGLIVEVESVLLGRPVWFASSPAEVGTLLGRGVPRGDVWSASELLSLTTSGISGGQLRLVAEAKVLFEGMMNNDVLSD